MYNIGGDLMKYVPKMYRKSIFDIPYNKLEKNNIKCLLFDLDNTLGGIDEEYPNDKVIKLINDLKKRFHVFIVSNNNGSRIVKYKNSLDCDAVGKALKPFTRGIRKISKKYNFKKDEMVIIGDQLVTDIYAGTRFGIMTILVDPIKEKDLWVTKINRVFENRKLKKYKKRNVFERGKYYE